MGYIITTQELAHLSEQELHEKYHALLADLARRNLTIEDCQMVKITLQNILHILMRKRRDYLPSRYK